MTEYYKVPIVNTQIQTTAQYGNRLVLKSPGNSKRTYYATVDEWWTAFLNMYKTKKGNETGAQISKRRDKKVRKEALKVTKVFVDNKKKRNKKLREFAKAKVLNSHSTDASN